MGNDEAVRNLVSYTGPNSFSQNDEILVLFCLKFKLFSRRVLLYVVSGFQKLLLSHVTYTRVAKLAL